MRTVKWRLKELLEKAGMDQRTFSEESGVRYGTVGQFCTNKIKRAPMDDIEAILDFFDIELSELMVVSKDDTPRTYQKRVVPRYDAKGNRIYKSEGVSSADDEEDDEE